MSMLELISQADAEALPAYLLQVNRLLRKALAELRRQGAIARLLVSQKLSRDRYRSLPLPVPPCSSPRWASTAPRSRALHPHR
jgi:hypothetical protein